MPIYMQYDKIKGDVTAEGHGGWIELDCFDWGVSRNINTSTGSAADRESSAPTIREVSVSKMMDVATPDLLQHALLGKGVPVTIHLCKTNDSALEMYAEYLLQNTMISGYSTSTAGNRPREVLSLNFTEVEFRNVSAGADDKDATPKSIVYSMAKAKGK